MRLPRDPELPAGLKTLSRLQFIHGFVVVAVADRRYRCLARRMG